MTQQNEWTQQYLRECMTAEAALAPLLTKWRGRRFTIPASGLTLTTPLQAGVARGRPMTSAGMSRLSLASSEAAKPPFWRRSWDAAGELSLELGLTVSPDPEDGTVSVGGGDMRRSVTERYIDHPTKIAAACAAIVGAATVLLETRGEL